MDPFSDIRNLKTNEKRRWKERYYDYVKCSGFRLQPTRRLGRHTRLPYLPFHLTVTKTERFVLIAHYPCVASRCSLFKEIGNDS